MKAGTQSFDVSFQDPKLVDALRFEDGSTYKEIPHGKGTLIVSSLPVEFAEGNGATAFVYKAALQRAGVTPAFTNKSGSHGVLIRPTVLADSVLYLFVSESSQDQAVDITDRASGAHLAFTMPAQRSRLVLLNRKTGKEIARYGF
jgi:hypothetical protein